MCNNLDNLFFFFLFPYMYHNVTFAKMNLILISLNFFKDWIPVSEPISFTVAIFMFNSPWNIIVKSSQYFSRYLLYVLEFL